MNSKDWGRFFIRRRETGRESIGVCDLDADGDWDEDCKRCKDCTHRSGEADEGLDDGVALSDKSPT